VCVAAARKQAKLANGKTSDVQKVNTQWTTKINPIFCCSIHLNVFIYISVGGKRASEGEKVEKNIKLRMWEVSAVYLLER